MELQEIKLRNTNKVMQAYENDEQFVHTFFDYTNTKEAYAERAVELDNRTFAHEELAEVIRSFMEPFGISGKADKHIKELAQGALTVVGGQQAGLLTGPLYSVHKAITVILLAAQQSEQLRRSVVPVFWIAGEDHDIHEINHVYTSNGERTSKNQYSEKYVLKMMASDTAYDQKQMMHFIRSIFSEYGETQHTKELLSEVLEAAAKGSTFTDFFVRLMNGLFHREGLLFLDSAYKPLRQLEAPYFATLIHTSNQIADTVYACEQLFEKEGFGKPIEAQEDAANLFYLHETGRVLLSRKNNLFVNEQSGLQFTEQELLKVAEEEPYLLSNNVATRPIMQDMVLPVLAFVGGPGELAYWALLKKAFHLLDIKMPVFAPRLSITLILSDVRKKLAEQALSVEEVMNGQGAAKKEAFLQSLRNKPFEETLLETEEMLQTQYEKLAGILAEDYKAMEKVVKKNLQYHTLQLHYLKEKKEEMNLLKHAAAVHSFDFLVTELAPLEGFQERVYTPYQYLNSYGLELIDDLLQLPFEMNGTHKIVYL